MIRRNDGILVVNKPENFRSLEIVKLVRKRLEIKAVGHGGALDPFATGVLIILAGRYTSLTNFIHVLPKTYVVKVKLGVVTDSLDRTGKLISEDTSVKVNLGMIVEVLKSFRGFVTQKPPALSSVKVDGIPAYKYFFSGTALDLPTRSTFVHDIKLLDARDQWVTLEITCGKGFYVRSFANDLGRALGFSGGIVQELHRVSIGPFSDKLAYNLDQVEEGNFSLELLEDYQKNFSIKFLSNQETLRLQHGDPIIRRHLLQLISSEPILFLNSERKCVAVGHMDSSAKLTVVRT
ncbi:MAG: tRNA pseudouridine(55) synthase TruB [Deltaproteobacteria bacterium]|nr:tRNA pseudouridine(55) synthase TruB [Deltaproteobacteria bacterium]